ncbi:MAG: DUF4230 domain-containing protein [Bacteroidia bacterium]|nr:DUF4230 domain-containing protein [Bacteroidia bacterium]
MQKYLFLSLLLLLLFIQNCKNESFRDRGLTISRIREAAELATLECVVTKTIACNKQKWYNINSATFMARSEAIITLGIDLNKLKPEDIKIKNQQITVNLPPIEILNFSYPAEKFEEIEKYTLNRFWDYISIEEKDYAYRQGETAIREQIHFIGITKTAEDNLRKILYPVLKAAGYNEIYIYIENNEALNATPENEETT